MVFPKFSTSQSQPQQFQRTTAAGKLVVYFLLACSAILLFNSCKLESARFEALIRNSVTMTNRLLPEVDQASIEEELFVPSLEYRIDGINQYDSHGKNAFEAHVYCEKFEKDLRWEWWRPNEEDDQEEEQLIRLLRQNERNPVVPTTTTRKRLLIGVSSGYDDRARLLERAVWSARVYAAIWSGEKNNDMDVTVVALQGTAFSPHGCKAPPSHSSIDKIRVLFEAIDSDTRYDRLLLLDADAMIYGMDTDLTSLLGGNDDDDDFVVMGPQILGKDGKRDKNRPWEISSGMTFWNLEHSLTPTVALDWFNYAKNAIIRGSYRSDQKYLHKALQQYYSTNQYGVVKRNNNRDIGILQVLTDNKFDEDSRGTIVKQFGVMENENSDTDSNGAKNGRDKQIEARLARMEETARQIYARYPKACKKVGAPPRYETS